MFILAEQEIPINLKNIGLIVISFCNFKNDNLNCFNLERPFDYNFIPLITSILECKPSLNVRKIYNGIYNSYSISYPINPGSNTNSNTNSNMKYLGDFGLKTSYPSFLKDIEIYETSNHFIKLDNKLLSTVYYSDSKELVRMYSRGDISKSDTSRSDNIDERIYENNILQEIIHIQEFIVISWNWKWGFFQILIPTTASLNASGDIKCKMELHINIKEDNMFINSKIDDVNIILEKIHKIISTFTINNST